MEFIAYSEYYSEKRIILNHSLDEIVNIIKNNKDDYFKNKSYFELLKTYKPLKLFMDIECVDKQETFDKIMIDFKQFIKDRINIDIDYVYTINNTSSHHEGLSYHVIIQNIYTKNILTYKVIVCDFVNTNKDILSKFIDTSVYSTQRLFRLPNMRGILSSSYDKKNTISDKDVHRMINENDIEKYIIQNVNENAFLVDDVISKFNTDIKQIAKTSRITNHSKIMSEMSSIKDMLKILLPLANKNLLPLVKRSEILRDIISKCDTDMSKVHLSIVNEFIIKFKESKDEHEDFTTEDYVISKLEKTYLG